MSYAEGHRRGSDPMLLWLWYRPAATAPVRPLAWELPYAERVPLEMAKRPKKTKTKQKKTHKNKKLPAQLFPPLQRFLFGLHPNPHFPNPTHLHTPTHHRAG